MTTLLDSVKSMLTDAVMDKASSLLGLESSGMGSAIAKFLPGIIGGLISKGNTEAGASSILDMIKNKGLTDLGVDDLLGVLGNADKGKAMLDTGGDLLGMVFGNNQSSILDKLVGMTGLKKAGGSMLLKFLAPIVLRKLAGMVTKNGWGAKKLSSFLGEQKSSVSGLLPGMSGILGFAESSSGSSSASTSRSVSTDDGDPEGGSAWKWLLPLLLLAAILFGLFKAGIFGGDKKADTMNDAGEKTTMTTTEGTTDGSAGELSTNSTGSTTTTTTTTTSTTVDGASTSTGTMGGAIDMSKASINDAGDILDGNGKVLVSSADYSLDGSGNLVDKAGRVLVEASSIPGTLLSKLKSFLGKYSGIKLTENENGDLVDADGKVIIKKGDYEKKNGFYYDKDGNKLGRIWSKIVDAVKGAADATKEAMTSLFDGMIKKIEGAKSEYSLSNITFNEEGNRITNFSKNEIEGLAAALKANADGKIVVRGYTNDGADDKANKKLSKSRANVVHDMLVTLGVKDSQISFKGMGSGDNKIEVTAKE